MFVHSGYKFWHRPLATRHISWAYDFKDLDTDQAGLRLRPSTRPIRLVRHHYLQLILYLHQISGFLRLGASPPTFVSVPGSSCFLPLTEFQDSATLKKSRNPLGLDFGSGGLRPCSNCQHLLPVTGLLCSKHVLPAQMLWTQGWNGVSCASWHYSTGTKSYLWMLLKQVHIVQQYLLHRPGRPGGWSAT